MDADILSYMSQFSVREEISKGEIKKMFGDLDIHPLTLQLLAQRGIKNKKEAEALLPRVYKAIEKKRKKKRRSK